MTGKLCMLFSFILAVAVVVSGCSMGLTGENGLVVSGNETSQVVTLALDGSVVRGVLTDSGNATGNGSWISILGGEGIETSGNGSVISIGLDNPEGVRASKSVDQSINSSEWTVVTFNVEQFDTDDLHDNVTNNSRFVCKVAGHYLIVASIVYYSNAVGLRYLQLRGNGGSFYANANQSVTAVNGDTTVVTSTCVANLSVNDYIEVLAYHTKGSALNIWGGYAWVTSFTMQKVR